jgi:pyruvate dehydrogenase E1 component alpha subunit
MDDTASLHLRLYRAMRRIRRAEEILMEEYHPANEMRCPVHFCVGQEASPAALSLLLRDSDVVMTHYRSHGYYLAKGAPLPAMVAEFYGKATGSNRGLGGSMELAHHDHRFYSGAIVGGPPALAVGAAFAQKYRGADAITLAVFGDGGMDEGVVYESFNLAALHRLPLLFLCENNGYAAHTPIDRRLITTDLAARARAFGVAAERIADADPLALHARLAAVVGEIRGGRGPRFVELETYRFCGHVGPEGDDELGYRRPEEVAQRKRRDPLTLLRARAIAAGVAETELAETEAAIDDEIYQAVAAAKKAPFPDFSVVIEAVAANSYGPAAGKMIEGPVGRFEGAQAETRLEPF